MPEYACIVQEGQTASGKREELASGLRRIGREAFGDGPRVEIQWLEVAEGFGFSAGRPSTSSIVVRSVPVGFPDDAREAFMRQVCGVWIEVTGCSIEEVVVTAFDGPLPL